jgi:hypothetical protein
MIANNSTVESRVRGLIQSTVLTFDCRDWDRLRITSDRIVGVPNEIRTGHHKSQMLSLEPTSSVIWLGSVYFARRVSSSKGSPATKGNWENPGDILMPRAGIVICLLIATLSNVRQRDVLIPHQWCAWRFSELICMRINPEDLFRKGASKLERR